MKYMISIALSGIATITSAQASEAPLNPRVVEVRPAATQPVATGSAENFTGTVHIGSPFQALPPARAGGAIVTFEARARTAWHTHPLGQVLIVTAGLGLVQQEGQPARMIRPGDTVVIPANVRHWHGAGPDGAMAHVAIAEKSNGIAVNWSEKVSEQQYQHALAGMTSKD